MLSHRRLSARRDASRSNRFSKDWKACNYLHYPTFTFASRLRERALTPEKAEHQHCDDCQGRWPRASPSSSTLRTNQTTLTAASVPAAEITQGRIEIEIHRHGDYRGDVWLAVRDREGIRRGAKVKRETSVLIDCPFRRPTF